MRRASAIVAALALAVGAYFTVDRIADQKKAEAEAFARKAEASLRKAEAGKRQAEADAKKSEADAAAAKAKAESAKEARLERQSAAAEAKELAKAKEAEARKVEAEAKAAADNARAAESELKIAEAKRAAAKALAEHAAATNAARQAELDAAVAAANAVSIDLQRTLAASNVLALQKADYAARLREVEQLQEELRRREEETRPNKTLQALIEQNDAAREAELAELAKRDAQYAEEEAIRRRVLREGIPAAPRKPPTKTERRIAAADGKLDDIDAEGRAALGKRFVAMLEAMIRQAVKEGRNDDAESYLETLKSLVPGYGRE